MHEPHLGAKVSQILLSLMLLLQESLLDGNRERVRLAKFIDSVDLLVVTQRLLLEFSHQVRLDVRSLSRHHLLMLLQYRFAIGSGWYELLCLAIFSNCKLRDLLPLGSRHQVLGRRRLVKVRKLLRLVQDTLNQPDLIFRCLLIKVGHELVLHLLKLGSFKIKHLILVKHF